MMTGSVGFAHFNRNRLRNHILSGHSIQLIVTTIYLEGSDIDEYLLTGLPADLLRTSITAQSLEIRLSPSILSPQVVALIVKSLNLLDGQRSIRLKWEKTGSLGLNEAALKNFELQKHIRSRLVRQIVTEGEEQGFRLIKGLAD